MIVAHGKFVLATPSKCGTHSFKALANATTGMQWINTMHLMEVPEEYSDLDRILIVRDPYDRLVSIYNFLLHNRSQWGSNAIQGMSFDEFVEWFGGQRGLHLTDPRATSRRAPWLWLWSCSENERIFLPDTFWHLEDADECLKWLIEEYSLRTKKRDLETMYRGNTADSYRAGQTWPLSQYYRRKSTLRRVNRMWAEADCKLFDYEYREV